jgi:hypothetical protein
MASLGFDTILAWLAKSGMPRRRTPSGGGLAVMVGITSAADAFSMLNGVAGLAAGRLHLRAEIIAGLLVLAAWVASCATRAEPANK